MKESNLICIEGQVDGAVDEVGRSQVEDEDGRCVPVAMEAEPESQDQHSLVHTRLHL